MSNPSNASVKVHCGGCGQEFTPTGLGFHLARTTNPACSAIHRAQRTYVPQLHGEINAEIRPAEGRPPSVEMQAYSRDDIELGENPDPDDEDFPGLITVDDSDNEDEPVGWEPPAQARVEDPMESPLPDPLAVPEDAGEDNNIPVEERFLIQPFITHFGGQAGKPVRTESPAYTQYSEFIPDSDMNSWAPFTSQIDWEVAKWAKLRGSTSTAFTDLLSIEGVPEALGLSYKNSREFNQIIDNQLPQGRPTFTRQEIVVGGEAFDVYFRPIIDCIKALYGDPEFAHELVFKPERHYSDADKTVRFFSEMHTAKWWWQTQKAVEERRPGATIIPVMISTDKTQTTMFRNKAAYPVYMTIGNIPKDARRKPSRQAYVLIGYLPTTRLDHIKNKAARRRAVANLYHACMRQILCPLKLAGLDGIEMASGDGVVRRCHPIFAIFSGDYPEQVLVTATKTGECPTCPVPRDELGSLEDLYEPRDLVAVLEALNKADGNATEFTRACVEAGIKPIYRPFWEDLPYVNIFLSVTSDVLHQLYQGVIKHVVAWVTEAFGPVEIDARCRRMPPNHNTRLFLKGITTLSRVSGTEHNQMCRILLGLIVDLRLPDRQSTSSLIRAVRGALDFLYLAQYPTQSTETISLLQDALENFHNNKQIFVDLGIRADFNFPKLHNLCHYPLIIKLFGSTDNYNTEYTERLHIDLAKDAYRATNRKDEYTQMTLWLERKEKILRHEKFISWRIAGSPVPDDTQSLWHPPPVIQHRHVQMPLHPSAKAVSLTAIETDYRAIYFRDAFARYAVSFGRPQLTNRQIENLAQNFYSPFQKLSVYHTIKFWNSDALGREHSVDMLDTVHVKPGYKNKQGRNIGGRFDTVLVNDGTGTHTGVAGYRVGRVRVVFKLSRKISDYLFPGAQPPGHLAYVEWFSAFPPRPEPNHLMFKISRPEERVASIIPIENIRRSIHLFPQFGPVVPRNWTSQNVLDMATKFYVSPWSDRHAYITVK
ncbi:hypothetical protein MVEN_00286300 [Mycena venus]|uniref:Uncharacterized protein n=1 Tax=Mycena venus TaxID=2733690 RepID=A0A8H6Z2N8_9AGAR|nr:hypothetical protein MVEN_00286300 [Mycena venus]